MKAIETLSEFGDGCCTNMHNADISWGQIADLNNQDTLESREETQRGELSCSHSPPSLVVEMGAELRFLVSCPPGFPDPGTACSSRW